MISESISLEEIISSAQQLHLVPQVLVEQFEKSYKDVTDAKFMIGLISGYINAYTLLKANNVETGTTNQIGALVAFLSAKYLAIPQ